MNADFSEKPRGIFGGRNFNVSSSLPKTVFKEPEIPPVKSRSSKVRNRAIHDNAKFEMGDAQSVNTMKSTESGTLKNVSENIKVSRFVSKNDFILICVNLM